MTCRRAAELMTRHLDEPLSLALRAGVGLHALLCPACARFRAQVTAVDLAAAELLADDIPVRTEAMPPTTRLHLERLIQQELDSPG